MFRQKECQTIRMRFFAALIFVFTPLLARAGGDEVVLIYNSRVPESKMVAEHYAQVRHVPEKQIYGFALTKEEEMSRDEFRDLLQIPLAKRLETDGLWKFAPITIPATNGRPERIVSHVVSSKIRYAVLCYGVPLKISEDTDISEPAAQKLQPELRRNQAAVDSELAWLPFLKMNVMLAGPLPNWTYGTTNAAWINPTNGVLIVTRLDGPTAEIANGLVDKAVQAEHDGLWGRAYFDARGIPRTDTNYFLGDEYMLGAAEISHALGFETVVDDKPDTFPASFPMSQIAIYCGWYNENACGPFALPKVEFMPGAFAYHLHSNSAATIRSADQFWVGPLLAKGATCTMGCVYEPQLGGTPNVAMFLSRWMAAGFTFGEAATAAQLFLSWQTTIVGDPLYRPFGEPPAQQHAELLRRHSPLVEWSQLRIANLALAHGATLNQAESYLENVNAKLQSPVLTEKLADLYNRHGKPASAIATYEKALQMNLTPEQRIRIRLTLGEKLQAENHIAEAVDDYKKLLAEAPDYPGRNSIEEKLSALSSP
jgi:uncharacterized protein (TIGR03790 family)